MKHMKKIMGITALTSVMALQTPVILAATPMQFAPPVGDSATPQPAKYHWLQALTASINTLSANVNQLIALLNKQVSGPDAHVPVIQKINTVSINNQSLSDTVTESSQAINQQGTSNLLNAFRYKFRQPTSSDPDYKQAQKITLQNNVMTLSDALPASDTLYAPHDKPSTLNDNYFDFDQFFKTQYTSTDPKDARSFITLNNQNYHSLADSLNLDQLANANKDQLAAFNSSPDYMDFQRNYRSVVASKSVVNSIFNHMMAERTPIQSLGTATGMSTSDASPLAVKKYLYTHRISGPYASSWLKQISQAGSTNLLRENAMMLAEIDAQMYQSHLDSERVQALLTLIANSSLSTQTMSLKADTQKVNDAINSAMGQAKSTSASLPK